MWTCVRRSLYANSSWTLPARARFSRVALNRADGSGRGDSCAAGVRRKKAGGRRKNAGNRMPPAITRDTRAAAFFLLPSSFFLPTMSHPSQTFRGSLERLGALRKAEANHQSGIDAMQKRRDWNAGNAMFLDQPQRELRITLARDR